MHELTEKIKIKNREMEGELISSRLLAFDKIIQEWLEEKVDSLLILHGNYSDEKCFRKILGLAEKSLEDDKNQKHVMQRKVSNGVIGIGHTETIKEEIVYLRRID